MADKKECDRCKALAPFGQLKGWHKVDVTEFGSGVPARFELCPTCSRLTFAHLKNMDDYVHKE